MTPSRRAKKGAKMISSAITFYFKEIFPTEQSFLDFLTEYNVINLADAENPPLAAYMYKVLFRRYHNCNVQYDTPEDFKCDLANLVEDTFDRIKRQKAIVDKIYNLTDQELTTVTQAITNSANNPNTKVEDPTQPLEYVGAQAFTMASSGKLQAYLTALKNMPTKYIEQLLKDAQKLFKAILPNQIYIYEGD